MKKNVLILAAVLAGSILVPTFATASSSEKQNVSISSDDRSVVFRSTQRLRASDGGEIYFYPSRKCEMYMNGRLIVETTYRVSNGEVFLLDEYGRTVYKGTCRFASDGRSLSSVTIAGTTYRR